MKVRKAVIPVAGMGTRFLPATKVVSKELLPIVDKPTIHYIVEEAVNSGIEEIIFVNAAGKSAIEDYFDRSLGLEKFLADKGDEEHLKMIRDIAAMVKVQSVRQKEARGLGHAVLMTRDIVGNEPFAVMLGDDMVDSKVPCTKQMIRVAAKYDRAVIAVFPVPDDKVHRYGIIDPVKIADRVYKVKSLVEKPKREHAPSNMAVIGRYILPPEIFGILEKTKPGKHGEIQITDALATLNRRKGILGYEFEGHRYDAGDIFGFLEANIKYAMKRPDLAAKLKELFAVELAQG